jgi:5-hydroxyisourate hydrolase-like protein (transthyretin family)
VKKGILRVLGVFVSLALMLTALPASMVMAAATVTNLVVTNTEGTASTNPYYGKAEGLKSDRVSVTLTGTTDKFYNLYFSSQKAVKGDDIGDEVTIYKEWESVFLTQPGTSSHVSSLSLPSNLTDGSVDEAIHGGVYYFYVTEYHPTEGTTAAYSDTDILFVAEYYIHGIAEVEIDESQGFVGDQVQVEGLGFAPDEYVILKYDNIEINDYIVNGDDQVDSEGTFSFVFAIPPSIKGTHTIKVIGENSRVEEEFTFTVSPSVTLSASSGIAGTVITVYGEGFNRSKYVDIYFGSTKIDDNNAAVRTDRTNSAGSITYLLTVPATAAAGTYTITIEDESNDNITASATFTVALNSVITLSKNTGNVGDTITVSGANFSPNTTLSILFDSIVVSSATITDASGNFSATITIPAAVSGAHAIKVGAVQQTFTVTSKMVLDKTQGIAGTTVTITGTGFAGSTSIVATFNNAALTLNSSVTDASGGFTATFTVPAVAAGTYEVKVIAGSTQTANFTVVDPSISLDKNSGKVGESITITGTNFAVGSTITFTIDGATSSNLPSTTANANGGFTVSFNIPAIAGGAHTLAVTSGVISKSAQFTVAANASIAPVSGNVGTSVTVTGTGFTANAPVTIKYNGSVVASGTSTTSNGSFSATFNVPASPGGIRTVEVSDGTNTISSLVFAMETTAPPSPTLTLPENASKQKEIITFDWSDVTDASLPVTYTLQIATDSGFTNIVLNVASLTASTYTLTEGQELAKLTDNGSYYWRVKATDAAGNSSYSNTSTFTVGGSMPGWLMWVWIGIGVVVVFIFAIWLGRRLAYSSY